VHAVGTYLPEPVEKRSGVALCLSGGGYRAALFHLGALRRLNEVGLLARLDAISSVSGGSIISGHLADRILPWPSAGPVADWETRVAAPFRAFTSRNIRTAPLLARLQPRNWLRSSTAVETLAQEYESRLTSLTLSQLPDHPDFVFCATDMSFGVNWIFEHSGIGDYMAGFLRPAPAWPVARAVAASSCFPPVFDPLPVGLAPGELHNGKASGPARDALVQNLTLTDGGVYDNMGLEPVWKRSAVVLVSDGGAVFDYQADPNPFARLLRYTAIVGNQARAIRKRWLIANFLSGDLSGAYWGIGSTTEHYEGGTAPGYSEALVDGVIAPIRTDLDAFSFAEAAVLENHGYLLAEAAVARHVAHLADPAPVQIPHPEWMDEDRVRAALRNSAKRTLLGRN
jgi:NTE family protein